MGGDLIDQQEFFERRIREDERVARAYLRKSFLQDVVYALRGVRTARGLTQQDVATALHTKQPSVARLENALEGGYSMRRFIEFCLACGFLPHVILEPFDSAQEAAVRRLRGSHLAQVQKLLPANGKPSAED